MANILNPPWIAPILLGLTRAAINCIYATEPNALVIKTYKPIMKKNQPNGAVAMSPKPIAANVAAVCCCCSVDGLFY